VKNRGVHCKLVLWLMRLSSCCRNRVLPKPGWRTLANGRLARKSFQAARARARSLAPRCERNFFSCTLARKSRALLTAASHAPRKVVGRAKRLEFRKILRIGKPAIGVTCGDFATRSRRDPRVARALMQFRDSVLDEDRGKLRCVLGSLPEISSTGVDSSSA